MANIESSLRHVADQQVWLDAVAVGAGVVVPLVGQNVLQGPLPDAVPPEAYGLGSIAGGWMFLSGRHRRYYVAGSGLFTLQRAAERFGLDETVQNIGA